MGGVAPGVGRAGGGGGHATAMGGYSYRLLLGTLSLLQQAGVYILKYHKINRLSHSIFLIIIIIIINGLFHQMVN